MSDSQMQAVEAVGHAVGPRLAEFGEAIAQVVPAFLGFNTAVNESFDKLNEAFPQKKQRESRKRKKARKKEEALRNAS
jgi:hypothetical protein